MIRFLIKGVLNDRNRSLLPIIVVGLGVALTVFLHCWLTGILGESIAINANFYSGHLKVTTKAYADDEDLIPNDCAVLGADSLMAELRAKYPSVEWVPRILLGGLADFPDANGETRVQGPIIGWGVDLLSPNSHEAQRFNLEASLASGNMPTAPCEVLIAHDFAQRLGVGLGDVFTLFSTTMEGGMAFKNFKVVGTVRFGVQALDRGAVFFDFADVQQALGMADASGEMVGFFKNGIYNDEVASQYAAGFNLPNPSTDIYAPYMRTMYEQGSMGEFVRYASIMSFIMIAVFVAAMSLVLWNTGLLGGLRRYNEFGIRLAMGEEKRHIYLSLIAEGVIIGIIGSIVGTLLGLAISYYLQVVGYDMGNTLQNATVMIPTVVRASITPTAFYIGFIPGLASIVFGNALSGIGIYKRQTANLFKELEV